MGFWYFIAGIALLIFTVMVLSSGEAGEIAQFLGFGTPFLLALFHGFDVEKFVNNMEFQDGWSFLFLILIFFVLGALVSSSDGLFHFLGCAMVYSGMLMLGIIMTGILPIQWIESVIFSLGVPIGCVLGLPIFLCMCGFGAFFGCFG